MALSKSGEKVGMYFDHKLWAKISEEAEKLRLKPTDVIRLAVRKYFDGSLIDEIEKLQELNAEMFNFIANKSAHMELVSNIARSGVKVTDIPKEVLETDLKKIQVHNREQVKNILMEKL